MAVDLLRKGLKIRHLELLSAIAESGRIGAAADKLGITQPAASRLASEVEHLFGAKLYERTGRGVELTPAGRLLAYRSARIIHEIGDAGREIEASRLGLSGRVVIGSVTGPAIAYVLPAIRQFRIGYPAVSIEVEVQSSDVLVPMLLDGRLDFAICRLPIGYDPTMFSEKPLTDEPLSIVARNGHPLLRTEGKIPIDRLLTHDWVLPPVGAILRTTVERALRARRKPLPERVLTTSSFLFTLAIVRQTNAIAPLATAVANSFSDAAGEVGAIAVLPTEFDISVETYSLVTRADQALTPAAALVRKEIEDTLADSVAGQPKAG